MKTVRLLAILTLVFLSSFQAQAGIFDFFDDLFGGNDSQNRHNTPMEEEIHYVPAGAPIPLGAVILDDKGGWVEAGVNVLPRDPKTVDIALQSYKDCRVVNSARENGGRGVTAESGLFIPTNSQEEWEAFKANHRSIGDVSLSDCIRIIAYRLPGACRHVQNSNYENREQRPESLLTCSRTFPLASLEGWPGPEQKIKKMKISAEFGTLKHKDKGNVRRSTATNTLCQRDVSSSSMTFGTTAINRNEGNRANNSTTIYNPGENPNWYYRTKGENNSKYVEKEYRYDSASQSVTVTHNLNGWGDCREDGCAACIGDVTVEVEIE